MKKQVSQKKNRLLSTQNRKSAQRTRMPSTVTIPSFAKLSRRRLAPLNSVFFLISIIGFFVSLYVFRKGSQQGLSEGWYSYGFAFAIVFACMFFASLAAMERASPDDQLKM